MANASDARDEAAEPSADSDERDPIADKLEGLPAEPGCYVFRGRDGDALYVGKAKSLRARVRSYFQSGSSDDRAFIPFLRAKVVDLETVVTATEKEAAILENSLIKELKPRFNFKLRDDKEFLTLRLATDHDWPRLELVRRAAKDGARYFGPYHSATAARRTLHLIEKHFQLRTCSDRELESRSRPCLQFQIKRCPAPCVFAVDEDLYRGQVEAVSLFLSGRHDELSAELEERMQEASGGLEYELAALYRDQLQAVSVARQAQRVVSVTDRDQDVLGLYREGDLVELSIMVLRAGRLIDVASLSTVKAEVPDDEVVGAFVREHYGDGGAGAAHIPDEVIVPAEPEGADGVAEWLSERRRELSGDERKRKVALIAPARAARRKLLELAMDNARHAFSEKRRAAEDVDERLARVQERLRLPSLPRRIECCDISHLGGGDTVGAVVCLSDGAPDKKRYRTYRVRSVSDGDDYEAMYEVLSRRFRRGRAAREAPEGSDDDRDWELPDLFVVDGGRGQLGVALAAAHDLGLHELALCGLAKERESASGDVLVDRVYLPGQKNPIQLRQNTPELFLLARARDEAHRFANRGRSKVGKRRRMASKLDAVPGVGPKTRTALLRELGSVQAIRAASDEQILAVRGVGRRQLEALRQHLGDPETEPAASESTTE